jgi:hypothetical protein
MGRAGLLTITFSAEGVYRMEAAAGASSLPLEVRTGGRNARLGHRHMSMRPSSAATKVAAWQAANAGTTRVVLGRGPTVLRQEGAAGRNRTAEGEHRSGDAADDSPFAHLGSALSATSRRRCTGGARRRRDWSPPVWAKGQGTTGDSRRLLYSNAAPPDEGVATDPGNSDADSRRTVPLQVCWNCLPRAQSL